MISSTILASMIMLFSRLMGSEHPYLCMVAIFAALNISFGNNMRANAGGCLSALIFYALDESVDEATKFCVTVLLVACLDKLINSINAVNSPETLSSSPSNANGFFNTSWFFNCNKSEESSGSAHLPYPGK